MPPAEGSITTAMECGLSDGVSERSKLARGIDHEVDGLEAARRRFGIN